MSLPKVKGLTTDQSEAMVRLSRMPAFSDLVDKVEADEVSIDRYWQSSINYIVIIKQKLQMNKLVFISILLNKVLSLNADCISDHYCFVLLLQQFFMWIESNTPELAVPYLWSEEKQSSEYIDLSYFANDA